MRRDIGVRRATTLRHSQGQDKVISDLETSHSQSVKPVFRTLTYLSFNVGLERYENMTNVIKENLKY